MINETLCEGCGDCNVQSNCISVEPVETEFGRKRRINQSSCNKDYSCVQGYCPSFVTVLGGRAFATKPGPSPEAALADVPEPGVAAVAGIHSTLIAGIGGGGVVTAGALLGVAAHIEGKGVSVLDLTGLAQKNGPVTSHVRIWEDPDAVHASRIPSGRADTIVGSDLVVAADAESLDKVRRDHTRLVVNSHVAPTAQFALSPDLDLSAEPMIRALRRAAPEGALLVDATRLVEERFGDIVFVNPFLLGICCQRGLLPVSGTSITRAMELNGRAVAENIRAFECGRVYAHAPRRSVRRLLGGVSGRRIRRAIPAFRRRGCQSRGAPVVESPACSIGRSELLQAACIQGRVRGSQIAHLSPEFTSRLEREFAAGYRLKFNLAIQLFNRRDRVSGRVSKREFGPWILPLLRLLARGKRFRGGRLDIFGKTRHRRLERSLIGEYEDVIRELTADLRDENYETAVQIASVPEVIRGFDTVKEASIAKAKSSEEKLLAEFRKTFR